MIKVNNSFEKGIEDIGGAVGSGVKSAAKGVSDQVKIAAQDVVDQLYGVSGNGFSDSGKQGVEEEGQTKYSKAAMKTKGNYGKKMSQPFSVKGMFGFGGQGRQMPEGERKRREAAAAKGKTPDEIEEDERKLKELHGKYFQELAQPKKSEEEQEQEAPAAVRAERQKREEEEKKREEEMKKRKKEEQLSVVQARTRAERRPGAG
jgi:hypothetical protein